MLVRAPGGGGDGSVQITLTHTEMNFILTAGILASAAFIVAGIVASWRSDSCVRWRGLSCRRRLIVYDAGIFCAWYNYWRTYEYCMDMGTAGKCYYFDSRQCT